MACPRCTIIITCGFLERPRCEIRYFYGVTGPRWLNVLSNAESARKVNEARRAVYGATHSVSLSGTYTAVPGTHIDKWDRSDGHPSLIKWCKDRSVLGCARSKNARATKP